MYSLAHPICFAFRAEKGDLVAEARNVASEGEEFIGELGGVGLEFRVVGILRVV